MKLVHSTSNLVFKILWELNSNRASVPQSWNTKRNQQSQKQWKPYHKRPINLYFILFLHLSPYFLCPFFPSFFIINNQHIRKINIGNKSNAKPPSPSPINKNLISQFSTIARRVGRIYPSWLPSLYHHTLQQ